MLPYEISKDDVEVDSHTKLGEGGFGSVYKCCYTGYDAAIKILACQLTGNVKTAFHRELEIMVNLLSPHIIRTYGAVFEGPTQAIVMEIMPKGSLYQLLRQQSADQLPWSLKYRIAMDIAHGIKYLHERNILHRDLKSLNVLLDDRLRAKLCDFGLAEIKTASKSMTTTKSGNKTAGTLLWMAPELFGREAKNTIASDIYALGMVFYELLTHQAPFEEDLQGKEPNAVVPLWLIQGERPRLPDNAPQAFQRLIERCWVQDEKVRPVAKQILEELKPIFAAEQKPADSTAATDCSSSNVSLSTFGGPSSSPSVSSHRSSLQSGLRLFGDLAGLATQVPCTSPATQVELEAEKQAKEAKAKTESLRARFEVLELEKKIKQMQEREAAEQRQAEAVQRKAAEERAKQEAEEAEQKRQQEEASRREEDRRKAAKEQAERETEQRRQQENARRRAEERKYYEERFWPPETIDQLMNGGFGR